MTFSTVVSRVKKKQIIQLVSNGKRLDGRGLTDYRKIRLETGVIERAEGSARVYLGKTEVLTGIKIEIGQPFSDVPDKGVLTVNAEFVPIASPSFEPGPPGEDSIELARVVDRAIRMSESIELEKLCLVPGKKVFIIFIDIYILNHNGNLIDAATIATQRALLNTKVFNYKVEKDEVKIEPGYTPLTLRNNVVAITSVKIGDKFIIDPSLEEEQVMDSKLTIAFEKDGKVCAMQKMGSGYFTKAQILEAVKVAQEKVGELRKIVVGN